MTRVSRNCQSKKARQYNDKGNQKLSIKEGHNTTAKGKQGHTTVSKTLNKKLRIVQHGVS